VEQGEASDKILTQSRCSYNNAIHRSFHATRDASRSFAGSFAGGSFTGPGRSFSRSLTESMHSQDGCAVKPSKEEESEEVNLADIKNFRYAFWMICVGCVVVYSTVLPFNNIASGFISHKYYPGLIDVPKSYKPDYKANAVSYTNTWMMVPFIISAVLSPFLGGVVDRVGCRANLMFASAAVLTAVHIFFALAPGVTCPGHAQGICTDPNPAGITIDVPWYANLPLASFFLAWHTQCMLQQYGPQLCLLSRRTKSYSIWPRHCSAEQWPCHCATSCWCRH